MATLALEQLLKAPNLPQLIEQAQRALRGEASKRQEFYIHMRLPVHSPDKLY